MPHLPQVGVRKRVGGDFPQKPTQWEGTLTSGDLTSVHAHIYSAARVEISGRLIICSSSFCLVLSIVENKMGDENPSVTVLVCLNPRNRPVTFTREPGMPDLQVLERAVLEAFNDVPALRRLGLKLIFQVCSLQECWGGGGGRHQVFVFIYYLFLVVG